MLFDACYAMIYSLCKNNMSVSPFPPLIQSREDSWKKKVQLKFYSPLHLGSDEYVCSPRCSVSAAVSTACVRLQNLLTTTGVRGEMCTGAERNVDYEKCAYLYKHRLDSTFAPLASLYYTNCWIYTESQLSEYIHLICKITTATLNKSLQKRKSTSLPHVSRVPLGKEHVWSDEDHNLQYHR